jgi:hypothetical protein
MRLAAKPNQNEQESGVVHLRCAAVTFVGCMGPAAVRRRGKGNFRHGGRTKEAISASRYVNELARLLRDIE